MSGSTRSWPPIATIRWDDTHRLIPASYADTDAPFIEQLTEDPDDVASLMDLMSATNARLRAQADALPGGIRRDELVFAVPHWRIINAAFCYPHPAGSRFSGPDRGAWYAARFVRTSLREVAFHKQVELAETNWWDLTIDYQDYLADIHGDLHDLRRPGDARAKACLSPRSYRRSQQVAAPSCWTRRRSASSTRRFATRAEGRSPASGQRRSPTSARAPATA